jgi:uncharacterized protein (TIGR04552 family)
VVAHPPRGNPRNGSALKLDALSLEDLEAVRVLLRGDSVVDWHRLDVRDHEGVDRFLRINEFEPDAPEEMERLEEIRQDAVDYLTRNFPFRIPEDVGEAVPARDLFLIASRKGPHQVWACVVLKVMHIIHHLAGRELVTRLPISDDQFFGAIERKVMRAVEELRAAGHPIAEFEWSRKPRDSLITKLLAKRSTVAASVYDKLRFRLIVKEHADLMPVLAVLTQRLIPYNYVVPGESVNHLITFDELLRRAELLRDHGPEPQHDPSSEQSLEEAAKAPLNEFSAPGYRIVNFVADMPLRVQTITDDWPREYGHVVFGLTEFQLCDRHTSRENEQGQNNHEAYKERQRRSVRLRLMRGRRERRPTNPGTPQPDDGGAD